MRLADKVAVVTGAASGIGRATAVRFAREGARLVLGDVHEPGLAETVAEIEAGGGTAVALRCDVTVEADVRRLVGTAVERFGRLDVMVNNAGVGHLPLPVGDLPLEEFLRAVRVNLVGVFLGCKHAAPVMARQGGGSIVNMASVLGVVGARWLGAYNASKGAVIALTRNVAVDYAEYGVRCNCICPGLIETPLVEPFKALGLWDAIVRQHLLKRPGRPEEVAQAALFLASDESSFITGTALFVDGGFTAGGFTAV